MATGSAAIPSELPTVSVVLVVRNGEATIAEALASVHQSRPPLEILVVDGRSSDRTTEIAEQFERVRIVPQQTTGIAGAYNEGIAQARGEVIAFISHDDIWLPGKLDRQASYMAAHPDVLVTFTHVQHELAPGAIAPAGFRTELLDGPVPGFIMETLMARPAAFARVGPFDESFAVSEDTDWFARARDAGIATAVLPETLTRKRIHDTNASLNAPQINHLLLRAMRRSIERKRGSGQ